MKKNEDNVLVNLLLFSLVILVVYYTIINPDDFLIHMGMLYEWISGLTK